MSWLRFFLKQQFKTLPSVDSFRVDLSGKTVIVVGSNVGLGLEAARHFASMMGREEEGGKLILACRNVQKGEAALESIKTSTGFSGIEVWEVDLADFSSIKAFATRFEKDGGGHLDLLVMNSGLTTIEFVETKDKWESQLQVNFLGTAHLSLRMLPFLSKASRTGPCPRLVIVASDMHFNAHLSTKVLNSKNILEALNDKDLSRRTMHTRYSVTKLFDIMLVRALVARLPSSSPVEVDAANPGLCESSLLRNFDSGIFGVITGIFKFLFARPTEEGGRSIAYAAIAGHSSEGGHEKSFHGEFISTCEVTPVSTFAVSKEGKIVEDRIWTELIDILSRIDESIPNIVSVYLQ
ncbi:short-chain dehydrogenase [Schizopora paradoxa]|uniref:Short-chain dehydrogenase n=1 Tax=Schizopora paradoxa TaxID=27342 RepID=A0A0H2RX73_9AGAM|nr:short-chain dehydrogenase [Schizopora paradoxa]